jgi:tripartite-type tricarboxylate transporter receptor subunit TctC
MILQPLPGYAQSIADYPNKPVRIIVAFAAGGGSDTQARLLAQKLSENLKRPFVVENRTGGGGTIAYAYVAKSPPDGYTLLAVSPTFTIAPALNKSLPYDPIKDFAPISLAVKFPYLLLSHPALPAKSIKELIALAKAKPGALDMGVTLGGTTHLATAYFASAANIKVAMVPYKGGAQAMVDTMSGQIHLLISNVSPTLAHVQSGRLRALAVTSLERSRIFPNLPTIAESGMRGFEVITWQGWAAAAGTPAPIINRLNEELGKAIRSPDLANNFAEDGGQASAGSPEQLRQLIAEEIPRWRKIVNDLGLRLE